MLKIYNLFTITVCLLALATLPAKAELTEKHVQVAMKSLKFAKPKIDSGSVVAFVYDEAQPGSKETAEKLVAFVSSGKAVKKVTLAPKAVPASDPDLGGARLVFVTDAALPKIDGILSASAGNSALTIASDTQCSADGMCSMTIETQPKVQIYLSATAAEKAGVSFSSAFMMLVKKH